MRGGKRSFLGFIGFLLGLSGGASWAQGPGTPLSSGSAPTLYSPVREQSRVAFALPYTMGTHDGVTHDLEGTLELAADGKSLKTAHFSLPISSIRTGKAKLDCHMQESLGLDYSVSEFPDSHVCDGDEKLPKEGKNAVRFPTIDLDLSPGVGSAKDGEADLRASWTVHGVKKVQALHVEWSREGEKLRARAKFPMVLEDFGIIVKKFLFVKVDPVAQVSVDLVLRAK